MKLLYVDEAGCTGALPSATSAIQPVLVVAGLIVDQAHLAELTLEYLRLKTRFFPGHGAATGHYLDRVLSEIKGSEVRQLACDPGRRRRRHATGFLDGAVGLLEAHQTRIVGRLWVKGIGQPFDGRAVYTSSIQGLCVFFQHYLAQCDDHGLVIADSRDKQKNAIVAHSIFTQKFSIAGDRYPRILEMPTYGHSENHVGIQIADLICSAFLFPMATYAYCHGHVTSVHVRPGYVALRARYGLRLRALQHRYLDSGHWRGGITVADAIARRAGRHLFE